MGLRSGRPFPTLYVDKQPTANQGDPMSRQDAARAQYNRHTFYVVFLVAPSGGKTRIGSTQRKNGRGLRAILASPSAQHLLASIPEMDGATFRKFADRLEFSNGWRVEFGGTIIQEANG